MKQEEVMELSEQMISSPLNTEFMSAYDQLIEKGEKKGKAEGKAEEHAIFLAKQRKVIARLLMKGTFSIPEIAETLDAPLELIVEIRDELIKDEIHLNEDIRDYTLPEKEKKIGANQ